MRGWLQLDNPILENTETFSKISCTLQSKHKILGYSKLLAYVHHFELLFLRTEETLCNASSQWKGHTELASAKPVSRVPAAQRNEMESGCVLPAHIWQSLIFMAGPVCCVFCLIILNKHKDSCRGIIFGLERLE